MKWMLSTDSDYEKILNKNPEKAIENYDDLRAFENRCLIGSSSVMGYVKEILYNEPILIIGRVGTHGVVQRVMPPSFPSDNTLVIKSKFYEYIYQTLKTIDYQSLNIGSTQPLITQSSIKNHVIIIPDENILLKFENTISSLFNMVNANNLEMENLSQIRDALLPKLISGEIRVI